MIANYEWDEDKGIAIYSLAQDDINIIGTAYCHEDDKDMQNQFTGLFIAEKRAFIKYLSHIKNNELKNELKALNHMKSIVEQSKQHNKDSYEFKMLLRQIRIKQEEIEDIKKEIEDAKNGLRQYIIQKDKTYQAIREMRAKEQTTNKDKN